MAQIAPTTVTAWSSDYRQSKSDKKKKCVKWVLKSENGSKMKTLFWKVERHRWQEVANDANFSVYLWC